MLRKFCRVDQYLRIAVGLEFKDKELPAGVSVAIPEVAEIRPYAKRNSQKVYLNLVNAGNRPEKIEVLVPEVLGKAPWGEIILNNNRPEAKVSFGREEEDMPFWPDEGNYVFLRLYRLEKNPFRTVYVRVDKGSTVRFFALKARWENDVITIEIEREPTQIPIFLT